MGGCQRTLVQFDLSMLCLVKKKVQENVELSVRSARNHRDLYLFVVDVVSCRPLSALSGQHPVHP